MSSFIRGWKKLVVKNIYSLYIPHYCHYLSKIPIWSLFPLLISLQWLLSTYKAKSKFFGRAYMMGHANLSSLMSCRFFLEQSANYQKWGSSMLSSVTFMPLHPSTSQTWINLSKSKLRHHFPVPASLSQQLCHAVTVYLSLTNSWSQHLTLCLNHSCSISICSIKLNTFWLLVFFMLTSLRKINCTLKLTVKII